MATKKVDFAEVLQKCEAVVKEMGLVIQYTHNLDPSAPLLVFSPTAISNLYRR